MAVPNSRTKENSNISIDYDICNVCGKCIEVCKDNSLVIENNKLRQSDNPVFGCVGCGHCMAICPEGAINITGRSISNKDLFEISKSIINYKQLQDLFDNRRSIREYVDKCVEKDKIEYILKAAQSAPMGIPPSDVNVLVLDKKEKVRDFSTDFVKYLRKQKWMSSNFILRILKPFIGEINFQMFKNFVKPLISVYSNALENNIDMVLYDAPLALYFYGTEYSDPADPIIAATYAMLAAESLGLGNCMIGAVHPFLQNGKSAQQFRNKWGIRHKSREGIILIAGYSAVEYKKGIKRSFANIDYV